MTYILIMITLNSSGSSITSQSVRFSSQNLCLQAMSKVIDLEYQFKVKAVCVQE
jgi:hypothetical protein